MAQGTFDVPPEIVLDRHLVHPIGASLETGTHELNVAGGPAVTGSLAIPDEILERLDRVRFGVRVGRNRMSRQSEVQIVEKIIGFIANRLQVRSCPFAAAVCRSSVCPDFGTTGTRCQSAELRFEAGQE